MTGSIHDTDPLGTGLPGSVVALSTSESFYHEPRGFHGDTRSVDLDPRTAQVLAAVLIAAAEQVSREKLAAFSVMRASELTLLQLSMAFQDSDTGLLGDVFEWCLLSAVNMGDPEICQMTADALQLIGQKVAQPQAFLVAAEAGRLVDFSPAIPKGAKVMSGRPGRPRLVENFIDSVTTTTWKADVLLGEGERWVTASLKSNPMKVLDSLRKSQSTEHPVRIGISPDHPSRSGIFRDPESKGVILRIPTDTRLLALTRAVLIDVRAAFGRHLKLPDAPLARDQSGIAVQLDRWRGRTVEYAVGVLHDVAQGRYLVTATEPINTLHTAAEAPDALIALDPIAPFGAEEVTRHAMYSASTTMNKSLLRFDPVD